MLRSPNWQLGSIHIHRSPHADATTQHGIRVTTPARTLVDLADVLNPKQLTRALNEAQVLRPPPPPSSPPSSPDTQAGALPG